MIRMSSPPPKTKVTPQPVAHATVTNSATLQQAISITGRGRLFAVFVKSNNTGSAYNPVLQVIVDGVDVTQNPGGFNSGATNAYEYWYTSFGAQAAIGNTGSAWGIEYSGGGPVVSQQGEPGIDFTQSVVIKACNAATGAAVDVYANYGLEA